MTYIYDNPTEIAIIRGNQFCVLRSLKIGGTWLVLVFCKDSKPRPMCWFSFWYIAWLLLPFRLLAKLEFPNNICLNFLFYFRKCQFVRPHIRLISWSYRNHSKAKDISISLSPSVIPYQTLVLMRWLIRLSNLHYYGVCIHWLQYSRKTRVQSGVIIWREHLP